jgi:N-6 DNA Methylase
LGAWYTPTALVDHVVELALRRTSESTSTSTSTPDEITVLDPACGDGAFLAGVRRARGKGARLFGVDIDHAAVSAARVAVPSAEIDQGNALSTDWGRRTFDVVIGNPPFLNQMASATTRGGSSRFGGGPYADAAAEFMALAISLAHPDGGRVALVLPQSMLSTRDAAPIRKAVAEQAALVHAWWSDTPMFDAAVRTCALVFQRGAAQGSVTRSFGPSFAVAPALSRFDSASWSSLLSDDDHVVPDSNRAGVLGDIATFAVDFRDQYYGLIGAVSDQSDGPPLVTSGLIEPGRCLWGERVARFAKQRYAAPRVQLDLLSPKLQRWAEARLVPKILIANQTAVVEAVLDREGRWLPSVPVITCTAPDLDRAMDVLSSAAATAWIRHHAAGSGLSAHTVRLTPALLASVPLPL